MRTYFVILIALLSLASISTSFASAPSKVHEKNTRLQVPFENSIKAVNTLNVSKKEVKQEKKVSKVLSKIEKRSTKRKAPKSGFFFLVTLPFLAILGGISLLWFSIKLIVGLGILLIALGGLAVLGMLLLIIMIANMGSMC